MYEPFGGDINVEVDLSNYAAKAESKDISHVYTSSFALKTNLTSLKTEVDKLDIDKLVNVPLDLSKLSYVFKTHVVKKTDYNKLVSKVDNIDTSGFALKTKYDTDKSELENKIPDVSNLETKTALTTVENKIPRVGSLVKKTNYDTEVTEIENKLNNHNHDKYITTPELDVFNARLPRANVVTKTDFDAKLSIFNRKITKNKIKHLLVQNELNKSKTFDSSYFIGKSHFEENGTQNYLVFQPLNKYFKIITNTKYILSWQSKGLSGETIKPPLPPPPLLRLIINLTHN